MTKEVSKSNRSRDGIPRIVLGETGTTNDVRTSCRHQRVSFSVSRTSNLHLYSEKRIRSAAGGSLDLNVIWSPDLALESFGEKSNRLLAATIDRNAGFSGEATYHAEVGLGFGRPLQGHTRKMTGQSSAVIAKHEELEQHEHKKVPIVLS